MSEDYVNQLTLNFLISKSQLEKLNKKKNNERQTAQDLEKTKYKTPVLELFQRLQNDNAPTDLLHDVRDSFDHFVTRSIYYLKLLEEEKKQEQDDPLQEDVHVNDELDANDDEPITSASEEDVEEEDVPIEDDVEEPIVTKVYKKRPNKTKITPGSESIQKLPLDWFNNMRQNYKMTQILPRKKEIVIDTLAEADQKVKNVFKR